MSFLLIAILQMAVRPAYADSLYEPVSSSTGANSSSGISISDVYSDIDMRVRLATKANAAGCLPVQCEENRNFDARVNAIGGNLSKVALELFPQQEQLIRRMVFSVADKQEAGTASNNKGQIIVLRGVQYLQLSDEALGFVIAREMAHVMAGHHTTNTSTKLIITALVSVLFPAAAIIGASSAAAQASTATTLISSAASTATSMVSSEVVMAQMKPTQLHQADEIAHAIMDKANWDMRSVESELTKDELPSGSWMLDLQASRTTLQAMIDKEDAEVALLEVEDTEIAQQNINSNEAVVSDDVDPEVIVMPLHEAAVE